MTRGVLRKSDAGGRSTSYLAVDPPDQGRGLREIARALGCSRRTVREVRDGQRCSPDAAMPSVDPLRMSQIDWAAVVHDLGLGQESMKALFRA